MSVLLDGDVFDVKGHSYLVRTKEGIYEIPVGMVEMNEGEIIGVDKNTFVRLHLKLDDDTSVDTENDATQVNFVEDNGSESNTTNIVSNNESMENYYDYELDHEPETHDESVSEYLSAKDTRKDVKQREALSPNSPSVLSSNFPEAGTSSKLQVAEWHEKPTKLLIELYREKKELVENRKIKTNKKMWDIINHELFMKGYIYTAQQVETKWKSLERAYKNKLNNSKKTGRGRISCPYERELSEILLKRNSIVPPLVLDGGSQKNHKEIINESGLDFTTETGNQKDSQDTISLKRKQLHSPTSQSMSFDSESPVSPIIRRPQQKSNVRLEVKKMREAIERRFEKKEEREERIYQQREIMVNEMKRRNDLLEKLVNK